MKRSKAKVMLAMLLATLALPLTLLAVPRGGGNSNVGEWIYSTN